MHSAILAALIIHGQFYFKSRYRIYLVHDYYTKSELTESSE
jgi:hypothetical protein